MNIPIYRAKKIDSDEYVEGELIRDTRFTPVWCYLTYMVNGVIYKGEQVDPSTLAIHFPDMLNSEGTKIFASLSEDGKGGDIIENHTGYAFDEDVSEDLEVYVGYLYFDGIRGFIHKTPENKWRLGAVGYWFGSIQYKNLEVTGIQL